MVQPLSDSSSEQMQPKPNGALTDRVMNRLLIPELGTLKESDDEDYDD